jgi:hypothetical protein
MGRTRTWLCAAAVLAVAAWADPAAARYFGRNQVPHDRADWAVVESGRFRVHYPRGLDSLALRVLDLAERTDTSFARRLGHGFARRVPIVLRDPQDAFAASDVAPGPAEAGGFTGTLCQGVAVPCGGSYEEVRRAVVRELARAWLFDQIHGGSVSRRLAGPGLPAVPAWFREGLAEYLSLGAGPDAGTLLRDGIVEGSLPPLERAGGTLAREQGRSAVGWLVARHGEERLRRLLQELRRTRGFGQAFHRAVGLPLRRFDEEWRDELRRTCWPQVATRRDPERFARRLTDHRRDGSSLNPAPAVSPQGDRFACFTDRRQGAGVYVMSVADGRVLRRVFRDVRGPSVTAYPRGRDAVTWSPDGRRLALIATSGGRDVLCVVRAADGRVLRRLRLGCDGLAGPSWSPVGDSLVVTGLADGRADLWLVDTGTGRSERLTHDAWDEKDACWTPDGRTVTFASDRAEPIVLRPERVPGGFGRYGLYDLDLGERRIAARVVVDGDVGSPAWSPDGRKLAFVTDRGGASDIVLLDTVGGGCTRLTEQLGGVSSLSWSRQDDQLVFSAFDRGGYDVFALRQPVSVDAVLDRLRRERGRAISLSAPVDSGPVPPVEPGGPFVPAESALVQGPSRYRGRLAPDRASVGVLAASGFGFTGTAQVEFSDLPGRQRLRLDADVLGRPLDETSARLVYGRRAGRWEVRVGLFHLRETCASGTTTTGEALGSALVFPGRSFGALLEASRPFDRFRRLDLELSQARVERHAVDGEEPGAPRGYESVTSPAVALVGDDARWGRTGPVNGARYHVAFTPAFLGPGHGPAYRSVTLDARRYRELTGGYVLATRVLAGRSDGREAPGFRVGGFSTLRGFPFHGLAGTRVALASAELRFPFVDRFGVVGPVPLGGLALRGALFSDAGMVWDRGAPLRFTRRSGGGRRLDSPCLSFGAGVRTTALSLVLKLDAAWRTDLAKVSGARWEFSVGPEF